MTHTTLPTWQGCCMENNIKPQEQRGETTTPNTKKKKQSICRIHSKGARVNSVSLIRHYNPDIRGAITTPLEFQLWLSLTKRCNSSRSTAASISSCITLSRTGSTDGHVCLDVRLSGLRSDSKLEDYTPTVSQLCAFITALPAPSAIRSEHLNVTL